MTENLILANIRRATQQIAASGYRPDTYWSHIPIRADPNLKDGTVLRFTSPAMVIIGTMKLSEHREEARLIVREGLADVLAWLGEPVEPVTGEQIMARMFANARRA